MSDEPVLPHLEEDVPSPKSRPSLCSPRYKILLCLILFISAISAVIFLQRLSWVTTNSNTQDIAVLKNQASDLTRRIDHLEAAEKTPPLSPIDPEQIKTLEAQVIALRQQVEAIQNQPKIEAHPQPSERSLSFEKEVAHLVDAQKTLKAVLLFWRLKVKVLSEAPYAIELANFKTAIHEPKTLEILEKYAIRGLQALKETPEAPPPSQNKTDSWWHRLKKMADTFIKVEKVDTPLPSSFSQDRHAVEKALEQLDQILTEQLTAIPFTPSPLPGDAL